MSAGSSSASLSLASSASLGGMESMRTSSLEGTLATTLSAKAVILYFGK